MGRELHRPQNPRLPDNCGVGFPASIVYDPRTRGQGVRCSIHDMLVPVFGTFKDTDGHTKPQLPYDNTGLQYGLKALQSGAIDAEAFVQLNEGIGSYTNDMDWTGGTASRPAAGSGPWPACCPGSTAVASPATAGTCPRWPSLTCGPRAAATST